MQCNIFLRKYTVFCNGCLFPTLVSVLKAALPLFWSDHRRLRFGWCGGRLALLGGSVRRRAAQCSVSHTSFHSHFRCTSISLSPLAGSNPALEPSDSPRLATAQRVRCLVLSLPFFGKFSMRSCDFVLCRCAITQFSLCVHGVSLRATTLFAVPVAARA